MEGTEARHPEQIFSSLKGLTSWLLFVMFNCVCVTFPRGILGQVWYLYRFKIFATFVLSSASLKFQQFKEGAGVPEYCLVFLW